MTLASAFNLPGGETVLILALVLILFGARKLPDLAKGLGQGINEFMKATRQVADEISQELDSERRKEQRSQPFLVALAFFLGAVCLILFWYELSK